VRYLSCSYEWVGRLPWARGPSRTHLHRLSDACPDHRVGTRRRRYRGNHPRRTATTPGPGRLGPPAACLHRSGHAP